MPRRSQKSSRVHSAPPETTIARSRRSSSFSVLGSPSPGHPVLEFSMKKSLDEKLARIHADPGGARAFILADAKDADMALGLGATGRSPEAHPGQYRSL